MRAYAGIKVVADPQWVNQYFYVLQTKPAKQENYVSHAVAFYVIGSIICKFPDMVYEYR